MGDEDLPRASKINVIKPIGSIHYGSSSHDPCEEDEVCEACLNLKASVHKPHRHEPLIKTAKTSATASTSKIWKPSSADVEGFMGLDPSKRKREYLIPKDKAAWLNWMVTVAKSHVHVQYLSDKELKKVIIRARPNLAPHKKTPGTNDDPDLPPCFHWNEAQVADWIASIGWPQFKETFIKNMITGRRLVLVDCAALNKMGVKDFKSMQEVAGKIRDLLGIPPPNQLRAAMRIPPYERFLRRKVYSGRSYDELTFEKFCEIEGFNYELVSKNRNMAIPCTTEVTIVTPDHLDAQEDGKGGDSDEDHSLRNAPTVEFIVRNALVRNRVVEQIMEDIMESVFLPTSERKYGKDLWGTLRRGIGEGYDDLYLYYPKQKLDFAAGVAHALIDELAKTVEALNDLSQLERHIGESITNDDMRMFRSCAHTLFEEAMPIVGLMALGELDLENIFKQEPEYRKFVGKITKEAERRTNELVPEAREFVDDIIKEALSRLPEGGTGSIVREGGKTNPAKSDGGAHHLVRAVSDARTEGSLKGRQSTASGGGKRTGSHVHAEGKHHPQHQQQHGGHPGGKPHHQPPHKPR